mgnify:FL=1
MLFDPRPKEDPKDLFDREREMELLRFGVRYPMTLVLGIRRSGKSSLVKVLAREEGGLWIYVDLRRFESRSFVSYRDLVQELEAAVNSSLPERLRGLLAGLRGVEVAGVRVSFRWGGRSRVDLAQVLDRLSEMSEREGRRAVVVLDEAQELRKLKGYNLLYLLAYAYDNLKVSFVLTGSEVGLAYDFLRLDDPGSPLFGRAYTRVDVGPFDRATALEFLRRGFAEAGVEVRDEVLEEAVDVLGGIPGWLTYYGFNYLQERDHARAVEKTVSAAVSLVRQEFENFLRGREAARERYLAIMRACARGCSWSEAKAAVEAREGARVDDKRLTELLNNLVKASFLVKEGDAYRPPDAMIARAFGG